jgi:hypothetical protein
MTLDSNYDKTRRDLENKYNNKSNKITMLFGHLHHAGGTGICELARKNVQTNPRDNCNHPDEFNTTKIAPTKGSIKQQLQFQRTSSWNFYAVELNMPTEMIFSGPFIYSMVMRHPYVWLLSQYRRIKIAPQFHFDGSILQLITLIFQHSNFQNSNFTFNYNKINHNTNCYRGIAEFILGRHGNTLLSNKGIYNLAVQRIQKFSVILLTEHMKTTAEMFKIKFGWNITGFGESPVNSYGSEDDLLQVAQNLTLQEKRIVKWYCSIDLQIYYYTRCLINQSLVRYSKGTIYLPSEKDPLLLKLENIFNAV